MVQRALSTHLLPHPFLPQLRLQDPPTTSTFTFSALYSLVPASQSFLIVKLETLALGQCSHPPSLRFMGYSSPAEVIREKVTQPLNFVLPQVHSLVCLSVTRLAAPLCFPICLVFIHRLPIPHSVQLLPAGSFPPTFKPKQIFSLQKKVLPEPHCHFLSCP